MQQRKLQQMLRLREQEQQELRERKVLMDYLAAVDAADKWAAAVDKVDKAVAVDKVDKWAVAVDKVAQVVAAVVKVARAGKAVKVVE